MAEELRFQIDESPFVDLVRLRQKDGQRWVTFERTENPAVVSLSAQLERTQYVRDHLFDELESVCAQLDAAREALTGIIEAADRIDSLDHRLTDGRVLDGKIAVAGTQIQDECQKIRELARLSPPSEGK